MDPAPNDRLEPAGGRPSLQHEAMNTTFSVRILGGSRESARGMVRECFEQLDFLEQRLSRFIDGSDVSLINQMQAGETLYLSEPCHQCLRLALDATRAAADCSTSRLAAGSSTASRGRTGRRRRSRAGSPFIPTCRHQLRRARPRDRPRRDRQGLRAGPTAGDARRLGATDGLLASGASTLLAFGPEPPGRSI